MVKMKLYLALTAFALLLGVFVGFQSLLIVFVFWLNWFVFEPFVPLVDDLYGRSL